VSYYFTEYNQLVYMRSSIRLSRQGRPSPQLLRGPSEGKEKNYILKPRMSQNKRDLWREKREGEGGREDEREGDRDYFT
jgi:hypothetical protein